MSALRHAWMLLVMTTVACGARELDGGSTDAREDGGSSADAARPPLKGWILLGVRGRGLWAMGAEGGELGGELRRLDVPCNGDVDAARASVAPDGRTIAYRCDRDIVGLDLSTGRSSTLSTSRWTTDVDDAPTWSRDGRRSIFVRYTEDVSQGTRVRFVVRALGVDARAIVDEPPGATLGEYTLEATNAAALHGGREPRPLRDVTISGDGRALVVTAVTGLWSLPLAPPPTDRDAGTLVPVAGEPLLASPDVMIGTTAADDRVVLSLDCDGLPSIVQTPLEEIGTACTTGVRLVRGEGSLVAPARRADGLTAYVTASSGGVQVRTVREDDRAPRVILDTADVFDGATIDRIDFAPPDAVLP